MNVEITLSGCDASTLFDLDVTEAEHAFLVRIAKTSEVTSKYCCMPVLRVETAESKRTRFVRCTHCDTTHEVVAAEIPCAPEAWTDV